jgi:hypothetical protein
MELPLPGSQEEKLSLYIDEKNGSESVAKSIARFSRITTTEAVFDRTFIETLRVFSGEER